MLIIMYIFKVFNIFCKSLRNNEIYEKYVSIKCQSSFIEKKKEKKLEIKLIYHQKLKRIT